MGAGMYRTPVSATTPTPSRTGAATSFPRPKGHAAGIGDVNIEGEEKKKTYSLNVPKQERIGGYKIEHYAGDMVIALMWAGTYEDNSGKECILRYDKRTKQPIELKLIVERGISFFGLCLYLSVPTRWKKPHV